MGVFLGSFRLPVVHSEEVSRQAPPGYEGVAKLLTPLQEVLHSRDPVATENKDGVVLLDEELQSIDDDGRRLLVEHRVERALNDAGVKRIAESVTRYRKGDSTIHLLLAQTVPPEGSPLPVRSDAVLLGTPQDDAGDALYDDTGELRIIFPNVKPLSVVESIVVIAEDRFRMPGEFTTSFVWAGAWPRQTIRRVVEMPQGLAGRLKVSPLGAGVPPFQVEPVAGGEQVRYVWRQEKTPGIVLEPNRAPLDQAGPVTRLSTLANWSEFTHWYQGLVEPRSVLPGRLAAQVDDWTREAHDPREILEILFARVAGDVRYTGLEFGTAALQPHDVGEVWDNQYGDCKDKANLLRAMLVYKGVPAYLTLLQTAHAGIIDRHSPGYAQFDHAIVAVELPGKGGYTFCDPTIARAVPGVLGPGAVDREVLVLDGGEPAWSRTPAQTDATLCYGFDLKQSPDGSLAGWLNLEASGYYGAVYAERSAKQGAQQTRVMLTDIVQNFYPSAEVVDTEQPPTKRGEPCKLRAYFVTSGTEAGQAGEQKGESSARSLPFPAKELAPTLGDRSTRETAYSQMADRVVVDARIDLAAGWTPARLPGAYHLDSEAFRAEAHWDLEEGKCHAWLEMQTRESTVPPEQFAAYYNGARSLRSWLEQPLLLTAAGAVAADQKAATDSTDLATADFPMMPSGDGQLELVDKQFPAEGSAARRRAALERTRQYFPQDKPTLFRVGVKLALLDLAADKAGKAVAPLRSLLQESASSVPADTLVWGKYVLGLALKAADQPTEAESIFTEIARDLTVAEERRAYAGWEAATLLQKSDPAEAVRLLLETLHIESDAKAQQYALLAGLLLRQGCGDQLSEELHKLLAGSSPQLDDTLAALGQSARDLLAGQDEANGRELIARLEDAARGGPNAERVDKVLLEAKKQMNALAAAHRIQAELKDFMVRNPLPPDDAPKPTPPSKADRAGLARETDVKESEHAPDAALRDGLALLTDFPPDKDFPRLLWRTAGFADWREKEKLTPAEPALSGELLDLCDLLPAAEDYRYEGRFLRGKRLERQNDFPGALRVYEGLRDDPALPPDFRGSLHVRLGKVLELQGDLRGALTVYHAAETETATLPSAADSLLRAAFIHLSFNERPEACRLFDLLAKVDPKTLDKAATAAQIKELVELTRDRTKAEAYWDAAARWWPQWHDFLRETALGLVADDDQVVPAIPDLTELGRQVGQAARDKDRTALVRGLGQVVHAARWQPSMTVEAGDLVLHGQSLLIADILPVARRLAIAIGEGHALDTSDSSRRNQVVLAANLIDGNQAARALEITGNFREKNRVPDDAVAFAMTRLWAVALQQTGGDVHPAAAALEKALDSPQLAAPDRPATVSILAELYTRLERTEDEEKLLAHEVENPVIKGNAEASRELGDRLAALRTQSSASGQFSRTVTRWLAAHKPAWFDYAGPKDLNDPKLADTEGFLRTPPAEFTKAEVIKGNLLIASAADQPLQRKTSAWNSAVYDLLQLCQTNQQARGIIEPILKETDFPDDVRVETVFASLSVAAERRQAAEFAYWSHDPLTDKFGETQRASVESMRAMVDACTTKGATELEAAGRLLVQKPVGAYELFALSQMFNRCLDLQAFPEAERLSRLVATMEIAPAIKQTRAALQLGFLRRLRDAQRLSPVLAELRRLTLERFPSEAIQRPARLDDWRSPGALEDLPREEAQRVRLWQVKTWDWDVPDLHFWRGLIRGLSNDPPDQELAKRLKSALLQLTSTDQDRANAVAVVQDSTDIDDLVLRPWLAETLKPYRDPVKWPETYAAIRLGEIRLALRAGEPIDLETELEAVRGSPAAKRYGQHLAVQHFLQTNDAARLGSALDTLPPEELLRRTWLYVDIPALELADRPDEATLARETARTELTRAFLKSWSEGLGSEATLAYRLLKLLPDGGGASAVPDHWLEDCLGLIRDERTSLQLRIDDARHRKDWQTQASLAAGAIKAFPTMYPFYYDEGEALHALGHKQEAKHPLEVFIQYSKNDLEYFQAVKWFQESDLTLSP